MRPACKYHNALQAFGFRDYPFGARECYGEDPPAEQIRLSQSSRITAGTPIPLGTGASMTFLHADGAAHSSFNDNSLVVKFDSGATRVLFIGDAPAGPRQSPATPPTTSSIEGVLLACCATNLAADVMIVGHHGSRTSSRRAFLDAVAASVFIVSSGPFKYSGVTLPDPDVIAELAGRGTVFRTDIADAACATNAAKTGPDNDGQAGGCHHVRVTLNGAPPVQAAVVPVVD